MSEAIDATDNLSEAVHLFSKQRAPEAVALVKVSRELDRPGKLGFITFILPIILDSIFHKLAPKLFEPNNIQMLQRTGYSFCRLQKRKRLDRIMQAAIIGTAVANVNNRSGNGSSRVGICAYEKASIVPATGKGTCRCHCED